MPAVQPGHSTTLVKLRNTAQVWLELLNDHNVLILSESARSRAIAQHSVTLLARATFPSEGPSIAILGYSLHGIANASMAPVAGRCCGMLLLVLLVAVAAAVVVCV